MNMNAKREAEGYRVITNGHAYLLQKRIRLLWLFPIWTTWEGTGSKDPAGFTWPEIFAHYFPTEEAAWNRLEEHLEQKRIQNLPWKPAGESKKEDVDV